MVDSDIYSDIYISVMTLRIDVTWLRQSTPYAMTMHAFDTLSSVAVLFVRLLCAIVVIACREMNFYCRITGTPLAGRSLTFLHKRASSSSYLGLAFRLEAAVVLLSEA
jgi:hypothetical protein